MLGSPILYLKGMGILMFQLSGFYCKAKDITVVSGMKQKRNEDNHKGFRGSGQEMVASLYIVFPLPRFQTDSRMQVSKLTEL